MIPGRPGESQKRGEQKRQDGGQGKKVGQQQVRELTREMKRATGHRVEEGNGRNRAMQTGGAGQRRAQGWGATG